MARKIRQAAVLGAGVMGGGIAALLAGAGIKTILLDIVPFDMKDDEKDDPVARNRIVKAGLDAALKANPPLFMSPKDADLITIGNFEDDFDKLADCDWIVEVVVENLKIKQDTLRKIEAVRKPGAIVSTNTSGIPLRHMSEGLGEELRQHFLGTHFFNPVRYMRLLEIIPGEDTLPEVVAFMAAFGEKTLGKGIVRAKDTPNFVGNRIGIQGIVTAMQLMLEDEMTIPEVDALFGPILGRPKTAMFKTTDLVGLDVLGFVAKNTYDMVTEDEQRDSFLIPEFVQKMIENKMLGKKVGAGFYKTEKGEDGKITRKVIDPNTLEYDVFDKPRFDCIREAKKAKGLPEKMKAVLYGEDRGAQFAWKVMARCLIYAANRVPEIADAVVDIDNAMKWGFNFEMGPFETWDAVGVKASVEKMKEGGFDVPENVEKMLAAGNESFYKTEDGKRLYYDFASGTYREIPVSENLISLDILKQQGNVAKSCKSASLVDLGDGVFCIEFHSKMNVLTKETIESMGEWLDYVDDNGVGLVIGNQAGGMPGAFSAGADLYYMAMLAMARNFSDMEAFLKLGQGSIQKAKYAPFPVVVAPYGLTFGGACELSLGADRIVAHADLYMGLVETGVGLLPAAGGCLNLLKKMTAHIPESVDGADLEKYFISAFKTIAMAQVSNSAADARAKGFLGPKDRIVFNRDHLVGEAKKEVLRMVDEGYAPPVKRKIKVVGQSARGIMNAELLNMKSGKYISEYDEFLAKKVAHVMSGGDVREGSEIDEDVILALEREAFLELWKESKTHARVEHMLKTGKPLRN